MAVIEYIKAWNRWRKGNLNSTLYKICVLIRLIKSPTFEQHGIVPDYEKDVFVFKKGESK